MLSALRRVLHLTPDRMRRKLLEEAERDLVAVEKSLEYYRAMRPMLVNRIKRLKREIGQ